MLENIGRLSPASALLEAFFDGLYRAEVPGLAGRLAVWVRCKPVNFDQRNSRATSERHEFDSICIETAPQTCLQVIEEDYFEMWAVGDDDTQGKTSAMFQALPFLKGSAFEWILSKTSKND